MKTLFCPNCGEENNNAARFCYNCGCSLTNKEESLVKEISNIETNKARKNLFIKVCLLVMLTIIIILIILLHTSNKNSEAFVSKTIAVKGIEEAKNGDEVKNEKLPVPFEDTSIEEKSVGISPDDYILPESDSKIYSAEELNSLSSKELRLARNEIYAKHGRKFSSEDLQSYFSEKIWYRPKYEAAEFEAKSNSMLNVVELENIKLIVENEKLRNSTTLDGYQEVLEDKRLVLSREEIENYLQNQGMDTNSLYYLKNTINHSDRTIEEKAVPKLQYDNEKFTYVENYNPYNQAYEYNPIISFEFVEEEYEVKEKQILPDGSYYLGHNSLVTEKTLNRDLENNLYIESGQNRTNHKIGESGVDKNSYNYWVIGLNGNYWGTYTIYKGKDEIKIEKRYYDTIGKSYKFTSTETYKKLDVESLLISN